MGMSVQSEPRFNRLDKDSLAFWHNARRRSDGRFERREYCAGDQNPCGADRRLGRNRCGADRCGAPRHDGASDAVKPRETGFGEFRRVGGYHSMVIAVQAIGGAIDARPCGTGRR